MTKALIRSMNRRGSRSDKSPPVAHKQKFSDPSLRPLRRSVFGKNLAAWPPVGS